MPGIRRFKGCPRCGGDLFEEPGTDRYDLYVRYICCLQCGELGVVETRPTIEVGDLRGKPGRPRKPLAS